MGCEGVSVGLLVVMMSSVSNEMISISNGSYRSISALLSLRQYRFHQAVPFRYAIVSR